MELTGDDSRAVASFIIYKAASLEEAWKLVENDVYYTEGVVRIIWLYNFRNCSPDL